MQTDAVTEVLEWIKSHYFGKYRGQVKSTADDTARGRLKVTVPAVLGDLEVWALPCTPYAGDGVGFYALPPQDSGVWVEFEGGDPSFPIWTGCFWAENQLPDDSDENIKILKTAGLTLRFDDAASTLLMESTEGGKIELVDKIVQTMGQTTQTTDSSGVVSATSGAGKVEVSSSGVSVNNGAWEVNG